MQDLRILLIIRTMTYGGGAESLVFNIYNKLKTKPHISVKLVSFQHSKIFNLQNGNVYEEKLKNDSDFVILDDYVQLSFFKKNTVKLDNLISLIQDFKPHIIHSHLFLAELFSREILFEGVKYFSHCHDNMEQLQIFSIKNIFSKKLITNYFEKRYLIKKYLKCNNSFISISKDISNYYNNVLPKKLKNNISFLPNAIDFENFTNPKKRVWRNNKTLHLVSVGSLVNKKNHVFLISVVEIIKSKGFNITLDILGDGANRETLEYLIQSKQLESNIILHGIKPIKEFYWESDIYVHPATYEPFGLVIIEAMAAGLPVVCLDGKGNRDIIEQGKNGCMFFEQNPTLFADKILEIWEDKEMYTSMSTYAVNFAKQYDIVPYVNKLLEIYMQAKNKM